MLIVRRNIARERSVGSTLSGEYRIKITVRAEACIKLGMNPDDHRDHGAVRPTYLVSGRGHRKSWQVAPFYNRHIYAVI
jgi:hypothetical protein